MGQTLLRLIHQFKLHYKLSRYVYDEEKIGGIHNCDDQLLSGTNKITVNLDMPVQIETRPMEIS